MQNHSSLAQQNALAYTDSSSTSSDPATSPAQQGAQGYDKPGLGRRPLVLKSAAELAREKISIAWLLRPFLERNSLALMFGELGSLKSFLALDLALRVASGLSAHGGAEAAPQPVVYFSAEGRGLGKRIRGWAQHHLGGIDKLEASQFYAIEHPVNLSEPEVVNHIVTTLANLGVAPALIVIDTLSRNSDGRVEGSTEDGTQYLNLIDSELRHRYGACILLVHHVGHQEKHRARGPYVFMANTDANFRIERPDPERLLISVTSGRMKDSEPPPPLELEGIIVDLGEVDEAGEPVTTLVLQPTGREVLGPKRRPIGQKQMALLDALERLQRSAGSAQVFSNEDLRKVSHDLRLHRNTFREVLAALIEKRFLIDVPGGYRLGERS
jgi:AAA domain